jgi:hypothetical protein
VTLHPKAFGYRDIEGVELDGRVEAVAERSDDARAQERADVVGGVLGGKDEGDEEYAQSDAEDRKPAIAGAMRAGGL